jgi:PAS domain S-box-containing protein
LFKGSRLGTRLGLAFGLVLALMVLIGLVAIIEISTLSRLHRRAYEHPFVVRSAILRAETTVSRLQHILGHIILSPDRATLVSGAAELKRLDRIFRDNLQLISRRYLGPPADVARVKALFDSWRPIQANIVALIKAGRRAEALRIEQGPGHLHVKRIFSGLEVLNTFAQHKALDYFQRADRVQTRSLIILAVALAVAFLVGLVLTVLITRSISRPAREIARVSEAVARGDMESRITYRSGDELGRMADSLRQMLAGIIGEGRSIKEGMPFAFWTADRDLMVTYLNPQAAWLVDQCCRHDEARVVGRMAVAEALLDETGLADTACREVLATGAPLTRELVFNLDGRRAYFETVFAPLQNLDGDLFGVMGAGADVTDRHEAETALKDSEARFRQLFQKMPSGVAVYEAVDDGRDFIIKDFNPAAEAIEKIDRDRIIGRPVAEVFPGVKDFGLFEVFGRVWRTGRPESHPVSWYVDGRIEGWRENEVFKLPSGEVVAVYDDVTEQRQAQEQIRESEERYRRLFNAVTDAIFVLPVDEEGRPESFVEVNQTACQRLGYTRDELLRMNPFHINQDQDRDRIQARLKDVIEQRHSLYQTVHQAKDGTPIPVEIRSHRFDFKGRPMILAVARDLGERRNLENQLRQSQKMEAVGRLAGGVAHDFNNLLTIMTGYSEMVLEDTPSDDPRREPLQEIQEACSRASELTRQLLIFSRHQVVKPRQVSPADVVAGFEKMLQRLIGEDIDLVTGCAPDVGHVRIDPGQLEQVVLNLAVNARDAMPGGGQLTIELRNVELDERYSQEHLGVRPGRYVLLAVTDTGMGMTEEVKSKVFEPFFTTKKMGKGTGLGLSTVYGIVTEAEGSVNVYSEPGRGTTFKVYLPRIDAPASEKERIGVEAETPPPGGFETILIVEDEEPVRLLTRRLLNQWGYRAIEAADPNQALEPAQAHDGPIHLMITDVIMPQMSGRELAERIGPDRPEMRILFTSGYTDEAIVRHGVLEAKVNFLAKPFSPENLARRVREILDAADSDE